MNILELKRAAKGWVYRCAPDAPDTSAQNAIAANQVNLSKEQLDFVKQIYGDGAGDRAAASTRAAAVSDAQLAEMNRQTAEAQDNSAYQKGTYRPIEQKIAADAMGYDTPERRAAAAQQANADVEMSLAGQQASANRALQASGGQPGSGKQLALQGAMNLGAAKLKAGAANSARQQVETIGAAKLSDAANLGRNIASSQATSAGLALSSGNSAVNNAQVPLSVANNGAALMNSGFNGAQSGLSSANSTYNSINNAQSQAGNNDALWGTLGQIGSAYAFSDKNMKNSRKPVDTKRSLAAVRKTPVESWKYNKNSAANDGGKTHVGPMAQAVRRSLGDAVAPGGKKIDLVSMNGHLTAAVQQLDKEVMTLKNAQRKTSAKR